MGFKSARKNANLTLEQAGKIIGVTCQTISLWEHGINMPRVGKLQKIADCYGCTIDELLSEEDDYA